MQVLSISVFASLFRPSVFYTMYDAATLMSPIVVLFMDYHQRSSKSRTSVFTFMQPEGEKGQWGWEIAAFCCFLFSITKGLIFCVQIKTTTYNFITSSDLNKCSWNYKSDILLKFLLDNLKQVSFQCLSLSFNQVAFAITLKP